MPAILPRLGLLLTLTLSPLLAIEPRATAGEPFTLAIIPDTQNETVGPERQHFFVNRLQWLADHAEELNLPMVLHVGDLVNWDTPDHDQFVRASEGFEILDRAAIAYVIAIGNHDTAAVKEGGSAAPGDVRANLRDTRTFNTFFPPDRFPTLRGMEEEGKTDNAYHTFEAGGLNFLVLNLELWPRPEKIGWANSVVEQHPHHNVIVLTHSYLMGSGELRQNNGGYGDTSPQYLSDNLIRRHPNIRLIFSGHNDRGAHRVDEVRDGHTVYAFLQCYHDGKTNPVRLLEIDPEAGTMTARVYCPLTDAWKADGEATFEGVAWVRPAAADESG